MSVFLDQLEKDIKKFWLHPGENLVGKFRVKTIGKTTHIQFRRKRKDYKGKSFIDNISLPLEEFIRGVMK